MRYKKNCVVYLFVTLFLFAINAQGASSNDSESCIVINTLVVSDRLENRVSPELYHAFKLAAVKSHLGIDFKFALFNPNRRDMLLNNDEFIRSSMNIHSLILASIDEILKIPAVSPDSTAAKNLFAYVRKNPDTNLAKAYQMCSELLSKYDFLLLEPTDATLVHPFFYLKDAELTSLGANEMDLVETVYALFFIDYAIKNNLPVIGSCHGAQLGWIYAGGLLNKIFDTRKNWMKPAVYVQKNPYNGPLEVWYIDEDNFLMTAEWGDVTVPALMKYPLPKLFKTILGRNKDKELFINKEMQQSLAMLAPVPSDVADFTYHPLSELRRKIEKYCEAPSELPKTYSYATQTALNNFENRMYEDIKVVDFYKYKNIIGTQYHPQYVYNDYDTSLIFDAYVKFIYKKYMENH